MARKLVIVCHLQSIYRPCRWYFVPDLDWSFGYLMANVGMWWSRHSCRPNYQQRQAILAWWLPPWWSMRPMSRQLPHSHDRQLAAAVSAAVAVAVADAECSPVTIVGCHRFRYRRYWRSRGSNWFRIWKRIDVWWVNCFYLELWGWKWYFLMLMMVIYGAQNYRENDRDSSCCFVVRSRWAQSAVADFTFLVLLFLCFLCASPEASSQTHWNLLGWTNF